MITVAVIDRTNEFANIEKTIQNFIDEQMIPCSVHSYSSADNILNKKHNFHLIFLIIYGTLDIQYGKDLYRVHRNAKIICIAKCTQYLEQAINELHAFAYLDQPLIEEKLASQLNEALYNFEYEKENSDIVRFKIIKLTKEQKIVNKIMDFHVNNIYYFEYINRKICIKTKNNKTYYFIGKMHDIVQQMQAYHFYACHQSYLVNMKHVSDIKSYVVFLSNHEELPLAQKRAADFRKKLNNYLRRK